ncbi:hypothetical protein Vretifemale_12243 [Volvox reticuliferus]|uniref:CSD domain-containing protein n=1 Tax=Volvox reticuliferus TaxID=1737510 RepID=A0A8J4FRV5_9CHLO|nr:hypothetical protein Vretifemale_12243 [Volvox reticuliferus]
MEECVVVEYGVIAEKRRNFGFISCPHRVRDIFFHDTSLEDCRMEQLSNGTAVTFVVEQNDGGKPVAKRVRLAPVGTRVCLTKLEPGICFGQVSDPAHVGAKGVVRFLNPAGMPEHLLYDSSDVQRDAASNNSPQTSYAADQHQTHSVIRPALHGGARLTSTSQPPATALASPPEQAPQVDHPPDPCRPVIPASPPYSGHNIDQPPQCIPTCLEMGQLVFFRIRTDTRAAQMAQDAAARGAAPVRRVAYQWAVELRPVEPSELAASPHLQRQAALLELLEKAVKVWNRSLLL